MGGERCEPEMKQSSLTISLVVACAIIGSVRGATLTPPPQTFVKEFGPAWITSPAVPQLDLGSQYTIEFWILPASQGSSSLVLGKPINGSTYTGYQLVLLADGTMDVDQATGTASSLRQIVSPQPLLLRSWTHVAAVSDGTTLSLYLDGVVVAQAPSPGAPPPLTTTPFEFGGSADFGLREVRIWSRALSPVEIATFAGERLSGQEPGLVANWRLDESALFVAHDSGPSQLNLQFPTLGEFSGQGQPRAAHATVLEQGPFFTNEGPTPITSLSGTTFGLGQGTLIDHDGDGAPDVIVTTYSSDPNVATPLVALHNDGAGHIIDATSTAFSSVIPTILGGANGFAVGDFTGDGLDDLFIPVSSDPHPGSQSKLFLQTISGQLSDVTLTNLPQALTYAYIAKTADIDGSGHLDIFVDDFSTVFAPYGPLFYVNDGAGHFSPDQTRLPADFLPPNPGGSYWNSATFVNARNRSAPDMVVCCRDNPATATTRDTLLLNDGTGHFTEAPAEAMPLSAQPFVTGDMATADFDGDGRPDVLVEAWPPLLFLNLGNGQFVDASDLIPITFTTGPSVLCADLDANGSIDLISAGFGQNFSVARQVKAAPLSLFEPTWRLRRELSRK